MATTVTYKGQTLATVDNQTKTLQTKGTWVEDDFTLTDVSGGGTTEPEEKDVDFIDYDGTLLYSYTAEEFLQMTELPPNPTREGLIAQGWNWTLADAKEAVRECGFHVIGQNYTTDDGTTRIYITIGDDDGGGAQWVILHGISASYELDWGDGTVETFSNVNNNVQKYHTYSTKGDYVIKITVLSGSGILGYYGSNNGLCWTNNVNSNDSVRRVRKIEIGDGFVKVGSQFLTHLLNVESVSMPVGLSNNDNPNPAFWGENKMKGIVIPNTIETIAGNGTAFYSRISIPNSLTKMTNSNYFRFVRKLMLPNVTNGVDGSTYFIRDTTFLTRLHIPAVTSLGNNWSQGTGLNLTEVTIPSTVTSIGTNLFQNSRLSKIHLKPTTPPTLANTNSFPNLSNEAKFYVPYSEDHSILTAYQTATNWSNFASKMEEEPA